MPDRKLIKNLSKLKNIKPDDVWKEGNRAVLFSQISSGSVGPTKIESVSKGFGWSIFSDSFVLRAVMGEVARPVGVIILTLAIVFSGGFASVYASRDTKPGDSLYIAKIISEKTQFAMTFDETKKTSLGIEFASNRAKEITQILEDVEVDKEKKVEKLTKDFKKEIGEVKNRLGKIGVSKVAVKPESGEGDFNEEEQSVFGANLDKEDKGMKISEPGLETVAEKAEIVAPEEQEATSTEESLESLNASANEILEEAEKLFDDKDYNGTIDKLEEANIIIGQASEALDSQGEVKGTSEVFDGDENEEAVATTTEE